MLVQNLFDYFAVDVDQPEIAPGVAIGKPFRVHPHQMQNRRVEVVEMS